MNQIKQIRLKNHWTQQYVADKVGITKSAYSNIENGNRNPSLKVAIQLQNLFNLQIENILENINNGDSAPTKE
jgi:putative transcriptional regulator